MYILIKIRLKVGDVNCVSPLKGFVIGTHPSGKDMYKITSYSVHHLELVKNSWVECYSSDVGYFSNKVVKNFIELPCGNCLECRLAYSRQWADRMMLEAQEHSSNFFLTLTYDNEHLHVVPVSDGSVMGTLDKRDVQLFMKRLRKHYSEQKIRYYLSGEYGDNTYRPHYHAILFGLDIEDLQQFGFSSNYPVYISDTISKIWGKGHVLISPVSWDTCAYTARYVVKKQKGRTAVFYDSLGIEPEFCLMSRRPGIARNYFDKNYKDIYKTDEVIYSTSKGGRTSKPPRYFDKCLERIDEQWYIIIKAARQQVAEQARANLLNHTKLTFSEILERRKEALEYRTKVLKRIL